MKKTPTGESLDKALGATYERIAAEPELQAVVEDLCVFTGLSRNEVVFRMARKDKRVWGAKGWFYDEWDWHAPRSAREVAWFYKSSQSYLFSNARHPSWPALKHLRPPARVLDYGGGAGMNTVALARRGFKVDYHDLSLIQSMFVGYRAMAHGLDGVHVISMHKRPLPLYYDYVVAQDVLEHMPDYRPELKLMVESLRVGGQLLERSPFKPKGHKRGIPMHMEAPAPLAKEMKRLGMKLVQRWPENTNLWEKC